MIPALGSWTLFLLLAVSSLAKTVTYDFNTTWVSANPDGLAERLVLGINGQWPLPRIEVDKGDRVIVNLFNSLPEHDVSIHFHGLFQNGTIEMDGPAFVTQCPVPPGHSLTYNFTVEQPGTYWYHSHVMGQYPDGYRAPLVIHDKDAYFADEVDEELVLTLSDWYHEVMDTMEPKFLSLYNPSGAEPVPQALLVNETQRSSFKVQPNKTYLIRLINISTFVSQFFYIEDHDFTIVEVDGVYVKPQKTNMIYITAAQRYAILVKTKPSTDANYAMVNIFDSSLLDVIPDDLALNQTNWLEYNAEADHPEATITVESSDELEPFDDFDLVPYDQEPLLLNPTNRITVDVVMDNLANGVNYAFFNNISYTQPKVPTLYTVMSAGELAMDPTIYGEFTNPFVLKHNEVVEIVLNNQDDGTHPFHLHGHVFQLVYRSSEFSEPVAYDPEAPHTLNPTPIKRDTAFVRPNGNMVLRFRADNPGVWLFHCHLEWHLAQGLVLTIIEAPDVLQMRNIQLPQSHMDACTAANIPIKGNAAGNSDDFLNLSGQNRQPPFLPAGFTQRGIVALVFSTMMALLGMGVIGWYGLSDLSESERKQAFNNPEGYAGVDDGESAEEDEEEENEALELPETPIQPTN